MVDLSSFPMELLGGNLVPHDLLNPTGDDVALVPKRLAILAFAATGRVNLALKIFGCRVDAMFVRLPVIPLDLSD
eukprot:SAG31_NODE_951_length_10810_cov_3.083652_3_plen_75_part_00